MGYDFASMLIALSRQSKTHKPKLNKPLTSKVNNELSVVYLKIIKSISRQLDNEDLLIMKIY